VCLGCVEKSQEKPLGHFGLPYLERMKERERRSVVKRLASALFGM
jgi:hypothetical protein